MPAPRSQEYCAHGSLYDVLASGRFDFRKSTPIRVAVDIASALAYLHSRSMAILHRDIKSLNVLISEE